MYEEKKNEQKKIYADVWIALTIDSVYTLSTEPLGTEMCSNVTTLSNSCEGRSNTHALKTKECLVLLTQKLATSHKTLVC